MAMMLTAETVADGTRQVMCTENHMTVMKIKHFPGKSVIPLMPCSARYKLMVEAGISRSVRVNSNKGLVGKKWHNEV